MAGGGDNTDAICRKFLTGACLVTLGWGLMLDLSIWAKEKPKADLRMGRRAWQIRIT